MASSSTIAEKNTLGAGDSPVRVSETGETTGNAEQAQVSDPQPSSSSSQSAMAVGPVELQRDEAKEKDKDKSSLSTTLTSRFSRRKANKSSTSENAPSSSTHVEKPAAPTSSGKAKAQVYNNAPPKFSLFSRIVRKLVPCTGSSVQHATADIDDAASGTSEPESSLVLKEKQSMKDTENEPGPSQLVTQANENSFVTSATDTSSSLPLAPTVTVVALSPSEDADVIVPPKLLLPESETEGVTSGAVQPPGSTGEEIMHDHPTHHNHVSGNETDETGGSGDEEYEDANNMEDEDDEDRLIRQGGAGIPIGPVSCTYQSAGRIAEPAVIGWTATAALAANCSAACRAQMLSAGS